MFKVLGVLVALYTAYAAFIGEVYARSGIRSRIVTRQASPQYFWALIAVYAGLSLALMFVF